MLDVLLGVGLVLVALGVAGRFVPTMHWKAAAGTVLCLIGAAAALLGPAMGGAAGGAVGGAAMRGAGLSFAMDGVSRVFLLALFLSGAVAGGGRMTALGAAVLAVLAADGVGLVLAGGGAALGCRGRTGLRGQGGGRWAVAAMPVCLLVAVALQSWHDGGFQPGFAVPHGVAPAGLRGLVLLVSGLAAALLCGAVLPAGVGGWLALYLVARLLLGLPGPATPGWWGVPVLAAGCGVALLGAWRAACASDLEGAGAASGMSAQGVAGAGLGVALLARGADLPALAALGVTGALAQAVLASLWGALLVLGAGAVRGTVGSTELGRLGGLMRRVPATGLALLLGLASMAAAPLSAGFAGLWLAVQAVTGAGRSGGTPVLAVAAAAAAALGMAWALGAGAALRLAGGALLGAPRSTRGAAAQEPRRRVRLGMAGLGAAVLVLGLWPWPVIAWVQAGVRLLTGLEGGVAGCLEGCVEGMGRPWVVAGTNEGPGYAGPALAALLAVAVGVAGWAGRGGAVSGPAWRGGLAEERLGPDGSGGGAGSVVPDAAWWRSWLRERDWARSALVLLGLVLAAVLGWAVR